MVKNKRIGLATVRHAINSVKGPFGKKETSVLPTKSKKYDQQEKAFKRLLLISVDSMNRSKDSCPDYSFFSFFGAVYKENANLEKAARVLRHYLADSSSKSTVFNALVSVLDIYGEKNKTLESSCIDRYIGFPSGNVDNDFMGGIKDVVIGIVYAMLKQDSKSGSMPILESWLSSVDPGKREKVISFFFNISINSASIAYNYDPHIRGMLENIATQKSSPGNDLIRTATRTFFQSNLIGDLKEKLKEWKPRQSFEKDLKKEKMSQIRRLKNVLGAGNAFVQEPLYQEFERTTRKWAETISPSKKVTWSPYLLTSVDGLPSDGIQDDKRHPTVSLSPKKQQNLALIASGKEPGLATPSNAKKPLRATVFDVSQTTDDVSQPLESEFGTQESAYTALGIGTLKDLRYDNGTLKTPLSTGGASRVFKEFTELQYTGATTDSDVLLETGFFAHNARTSPIQIRNMGNDFKGEAEHASHATQESIPAPDSFQASSPNISPAKSPTSFDSEEDALDSSPHVSTDPVLSPGVAFIQKATEWRKKARSSSGSGSESGQDVASSETVRPSVKSPKKQVLRQKESPSSAKKHSQEERATKELEAIRELEELRATVEKLRLDNERAQAAVKLAEEEKERAKEAAFKEMQLKLDTLAAAKEALREESERNAETLKKELEEKVRELTAAQVLIEKQKIAQEEAIKAREANEVLQREISAKQQELVEELNLALRDKEKNAVLINDMKQEAEVLASEAKKLAREKQALENQVKVTGASLEETTNNLEKLVTLMELQGNQEIDVRKYAEHGTYRAAQDFIGMELELRRTIDKTGFKKIEGERK